MVSLKSLILGKFSTMITKLKFIFKNVLKALAARSNMLYLIYAILIDKSFNREILAVKSGQAEINRRISGELGAEFRLRRNIHRIEKGLIMRQRRKVFAVGYICETIDALEKIVGRYCYSSLTFEVERNIKWYTDVLEEYFRVVEGDPTVEACRQRFDRLSAKIKASDESMKSIPQSRHQFSVGAVNYDNLASLMRQRRSVRWYLPKSVPRRELDKAISLAALSPSACNRQPFRFLVCDSPTRVEKIAALAGGTEGFNHQFPSIIVVIGRLDAYEHTRDRHLIYIDSALASMSLMLALETLGLSSCAINWPDIEYRERLMEEELGIPSYERVIMLISVGFADPNGKIPFSEKKVLEDLRTFLPR